MPSERFDREEFRWWLAVQDPNARPFDRKCPVATWRKACGEELECADVYSDDDRMDWADRFASTVDTATSDGHRLLWQTLTVKDALTILDGIE